MFVRGIPSLTFLFFQYSLILKTLLVFLELAVSVLGRWLALAPPLPPSWGQHDRTTTIEQIETRHQHQHMAISRHKFISCKCIVYLVLDSSKPKLERRKSVQVYIRRLDPAYPRTAPLPDDSWCEAVLMSHDSKHGRPWHLRHGCPGENFYDNFMSFGPFALNIEDRGEETRKFAILQFILGLISFWHPILDEKHLFMLKCM